MGGGATMRAASKIAGFGNVVAHGGLRGTAAPSAMPAEHAVRKSSIPVSAMVSSSSSTRVGADVSAVQKPASETNGWEFAGGVEDDLVMEAGEPMPRVVFSGVPSFDEAKEATAELKDAVDKLCLSLPKSSESKEVAASNQLSLVGLSLVWKPYSEEISCLVAETDGTLSATNHVIKALKLLCTSPQVQNVVTSVVYDPKVWNAVINNSVLQDFMRSNQTNFKFQEPDSAEKFEVSSVEPEAQPSKNWFAGMVKKIKLTTVNLVKKIKLTTVDLVTYLSSKFQNVFDYPSDANEDDKAGYENMARGVSFMGLVMIVVMIVLLKRV